MTYSIDDEVPYVYIFGRNQENQSFFAKKKFIPYFFVKEEITKYEDIVSIEDTSLTTPKDEPVKKVITKTPKDVAKIRKKLEELDISLIISMIREKQDPALTRPPFQNIQLSVTDFVLMPISIDKLRQGIETALPVIENGRYVLT